MSDSQSSWWRRWKLPLLVRLIREARDKRAHGTITNLGKDRHKRLDDIQLPQKFVVSDHIEISLQIIKTKSGLPFWPIPRSISGLYIIQSN